MLGVLQKTPDEWFERRDEASAEIEALVAARLAARQARNWPEADRLKQQLLALGVTLEDRKDGGTIWYRRKPGTA